jgi:ATP-dependent helicase HrpB
LRTALNIYHQAVLQAPPGAGKTTQIPLSLLNEPWLAHQKIVMLEPRRVAALNAATRMAHLLGEEVGQTVGYRMRQATKVSARTRIEVITEGLLTRWLQEDPELTGVGLLIFDEFHERSLNSDAGLALALQARALFRADEHPLKLLVMSATLEGENIAALLLAPEGNTELRQTNPGHIEMHRCPMITSEGRSFPVVVHYRLPPTRLAKSAFANALLPLLVETIHYALNNDKGSILVFLPGVKEINLTQAALAHNLPDNISVLPLHGGLKLAEQQAAIVPLQGPNKSAKKIVLATDIAETSLTIEGVSVVIDTGLTRNPEFDPNTGLTRLHTQPISQASAEQRAGRAGRMEPGVCYRLWSQAQHHQRAKYSTAEILSADLMPLALTLIDWGVDNPNELQWLNPPPQANWRQALDALRKIGILTVDNQLTAMGNQASQFACHPRLARLMIEAQHQGAGLLGATLAALLSERLPRHLGTNLADHLNALKSNLSTKTDQHWRERVRQLTQQLSKNLLNLPNKGSPSHRLSEDDLSGLIIAKAFPEHIAKRKSLTNESAIFQLANGRAAQLPISDPLAHSQWLSIADAGGLAGNSHDVIFAAANLNPRFFDDELASYLHSETIAQWQHDKGRFIAEERRCLGNIIIQQKTLLNISADIKRQALTTLIRDQGLDLLDWSDDAKQLAARVNFLRRVVGQPWPDMSNEGLLHQLDDWLTPHLDSVKTLNDFKKIPVADLLNALLPWPLVRELNQLAPTTIAIPSGRNAMIDYRQSPPVLAVKLQEMFGCSSTPTIVNGQQTLMLHLLSPAKQPLQITQDLAAFWANSYDDVKKQMKGRYPRHPWPDNPLTMAATAKTKRALGRQIDL